MSDYTQITDFSVKDGLTTGDSEKIILGADVDAELSAISTAIATKYDSTDLASQAQAEALSSNLVLMTPGRVNDVLADNAGILGDLQALTSPGADRILFWDNGAGAAAFLTVSTGLTLSGTNLTSDDANIDHDSLSNFVADEHVAHSSISVIAGAGMTGGGTIDGNVTLNVIGGDGITVNADDVEVDESFAFAWTGAQTFAAQVSFNGAVVKQVVSASITGTQSDWAPTGLDTASILRITGGASTPQIGGLDIGQVDGRMIYIYNASGSSFTIDDEDAGSAAANRFDTTGSGLAVGDRNGVTVWYDGTSARWRVMDV